MPSPRSRREAASGPSPPPPPPSPPMGVPASSSPSPASSSPSSSESQPGLRNPLLAAPPPPPPPSLSPPPRLSSPQQLQSPPPPSGAQTGPCAVFVVLGLPVLAATGTTVEHRYRPELSYTPPYTTPLASKPFRFSDYVQGDRHIFLKGASLGIGSGLQSPATGNGSGSPWQHSSDIITWAGELGKVNIRDCTVDDQDIVIYKGQYLRLGSTMSLGQDHLPALNHVHQAMPEDQRRSATAAVTAAGSRAVGPEPPYRPQQKQQQQQSGPLSRQSSRLHSRRTRPFNEPLNTYVDTQKRIRAVQCLEDLYRQSPVPALPYLAPPSASSLAVPRAGRLLPRPARVMIHVPRISEPYPSHHLSCPPSPPHPALFSSTRHATTLRSKAPASLDAPTSNPASLIPDGSPKSPDRDVANSTQLQPRATVMTSGRSQASSEGKFTSAGITLLPPSLQAGKPRLGEQQLVSEFLLARKILQHSSQPALGTQHQPSPGQASSSGSRDYVNYFQAKENESGGTFHRLFESYPKRVLTVHPGRIQRQRTDILSPSKLRQLLP